MVAPIGREADEARRGWEQEVAGGGRDWARGRSGKRLGSKSVVGLAVVVLDDREEGREENETKK